MLLIKLPEMVELLSLKCCFLGQRHPKSQHLGGESDVAGSGSHASDRGAPLVLVAFTGHS